MTPKFKMFLIYALCFLGIFMLVWFIAGMLFDEESWLRKLTPILVSIVAAPKPHVENAQSGPRYGLKSIFSRKIFWM